jgi:hypothetical protein
MSYDNQRGNMKKAKILKTLKDIYTKLREMQTEDSDVDELSNVERSNFFDEWVDILDSASFDSLTINHRTILGTLISLTKDKDISDFSDNLLIEFQKACNILRQPSVTKQESKRIINNLLNENVKLVMPMSINDDLPDEDIYTLENMMNELIKKSN